MKYVVVKSGIQNLLLTFPFHLQVLNLIFSETLQPKPLSETVFFIYE